MAPLDRSIVSPILIGRRHELAILERALSTAIQGRGQTLLFAGDAGVGKSRLLDDIAARAASQGWTLLHGNCFEQDTAYPYSLWIDTLRNHVAATNLKSCQEAFGPFGAELTKFFPEIVPSPPELAYQPALDPETAKRRLFDALTYFFTTISSAHPLLLRIEDLHWSDQSSLDYLHFLLRRLPTLPILLLITYRHHEAPSPLQHFLAQLDREHLGRELQLETLSQAEVEQMVVAILNPPQPLPAELLKEIYTYTEGNAFFVEEILKLWLAAGEIQPSAERWARARQGWIQIPRSVLDIVQQRTARLSPAAKELLTLAAVIGRRFDFGLLPPLLERAEREVITLVKELITAQLLIEESSDQLAFRHALTREAAYTTLLRRERKIYHSKIFEGMEKTYAPSADRYWGELAHHAYEAGMWQQALDYSQRAGNQAQTLYAAGEAVVHFTRAVEATRQMQEVPTAALLRARGKAYETMGDFDAARTDFEASLDAAQQLKDGESEWQASLDLGFVWSAHDYQAAGEHFQHALTLARTLNQPTLIAHSLNRVGNWYANVQQPTVALSYHHDALNHFSELGDQRGLAETYDLLGMTSQLNSDLVSSHRAYQQAISRWRQLQDRMGLVGSLASLPLCTASYLKNLDVPAIPLHEAVDAAEEARQIAQSIHWRAGEAFATLMLAMCLGAQGNYRRALDMANLALRCAEEIEHRQWTVAAHMALGILYLDLLALQDARRHLETALALAKAVGSQVWIDLSVGYLASTHVASGMVRQAKALLMGMLPADTPMKMQGHRLLWFAQAQIALAEGDAPTAYHITQELTTSAQNLSPGQLIPRLALLQGESLMYLGNFETATELLHATRLAATAQGARSQEWRILVALGKCLQAQAKRSEARASYATVRVLLDNMTSEIADVSLGRNLLEQALASLPPPVAPTPNQIAKQNSGGLTAREREVALLVAEGKSNQEIAARLVVGIRTVEAHITRILAKLDFSSRVQIAAWVIEQRPTRHDDPDT